MGCIFWLLCLHLLTLHRILWGCMSARQAKYIDFLWKCLKAIGFKMLIQSIKWLIECVFDFEL